MEPTIAVLHLEDTNETRNESSCSLVIAKTGEYEKKLRAPEFTVDVINRAGGKRPSHWHIYFELEQMVSAERTDYVSELLACLTNELRKIFTVVLELLRTNYIRLLQPTPLVTSPYSSRSTINSTSIEEITQSINYGFFTSWSKSINAGFLAVSRQAGGLSITAQD